MQLLAGSSGTERDAGKAAQTTGRTKIAQPVASTSQNRAGFCCNPTSGVTQGLCLNQFKGFVALDTHTVKHLFCTFSSFYWAVLLRFVFLLTTFITSCFLNTAWLERQALYRHARGPARLDNSLKGKKKRADLVGRKWRQNFAAFLQCNEKRGKKQWG